MDTTRLPSIVRPLFIVGALVLLILAMRLAAAFLIPILLALFFSVLLHPLYGWLKRKGVPAALALLLTGGFLLLIVLGFGLLIGASLVTLTADLAQYRAEFGQRQAELQTALASLGQVPGVQSLLASLNPDNLTGLLQAFLTAIAGVAVTGVYVFFIMIFFLMEGSMFGERMIEAFGATHPVNLKTRAMLRSFIRYFGLRTIVNFITACGVTIALLLLGIDNAGLWGLLTFFLSYIPYIGIVVALTPPVLLAYAEFGLQRALLVILLAVVVNAAAENVVAPLVMGKGLKISPTVVFISFLFWMGILGSAGALVAMPLTVAVIMALGSFAETRPWAALMGSIPEEPPPAPAGQPEADAAL